MARSVFALLVGIDNYTSSIPILRGCVNDLEAFASYLLESVAKDQNVLLEVRSLKNDEATREAVISAFREHLCNAKNGDVALFYYSGHGSQEQAPEEFWKIEPDHLNETLVLFDSREPGKWDLADKELAKLIGEVAAKGPHVVVILDCCHSGSGTREIGTVVRRAPTDLRRRPIKTFLVSAAEAEAAAASRGADSKASAWATATEGRHVLLAACRDDEEAKEYVGDGKHRGALSFFLENALKSAAGVPTYRDLFARSSALVANQVPNQSPQLEATNNDDLDGVFLDGAIQPAPAAFTASLREGRWSINGGQANGIPASSGADSVRLALFAFDAPADVLADPAKAMATARVEDVFPVSSRIGIEGGAALDTKQTYKALIISLPTPPMAVRLEGDASVCPLARTAVESASPEGKPSLFVRVAEEGENAEFRLIARDGQFIITKPNDERPLVAQIDRLDEGGARLAVQRLEHIARWTQTARLSNPASTILPGDVKLTILVDGKEVSGREIRLEYQVKDGKSVPPTFQVSMTNNSGRTLFCGLLDLTQRFRVDAGLLKAGSVKIEPGETAWGNEGRPIPATVPEEVWKQGIIEYKDLLKLIVCTEEFDPRRLEQPSLDMPRPASGTKSLGTRGFGRNGSLNRLMAKIQTRELVEEEAAAIDDWQATEVAFTTVRPLATTPLAVAGQSVTLAGGVKVEGHAAFKAGARLATAPLSTRDLGNVRLPRLLYDDPSVVQPLTFTASRGNDPGLSVLELTDVADPSVVTPEAPLRLSVPISVAPHEHVLPVAYDGEFFLPLGRVESRSESETVIALDRLPPPLSDRRSLSGAIKIFFQKVISQVAETEFAYPILAAVEVSPGGDLTSVREADAIRERVGSAGRILLFVHGITGDTRNMAPSIQLAKLADGRPLGSLYDLVLTFDYENLNTTIEDNGRALKARLEAVGLVAGHGKSLDIAAHSMGGLVSRWFIEREGGNRVVSRLIMLGTPNGGSPWPRVVDWATLALALGLNQLTAIAWPATVLGGLTALTENPTVALHELAPGSPVLKSLESSTDPGVPYIMLAGNTSIIPTATESPDAEKGSQLGRLLTRLAPSPILHAVATPFFHGEDNDIAVSTASMRNIAAGREPAFEVRPVGCDHLSYFRDPAGLQALVQVLSAP
jgi:hypothetical protein